MHAVLPSAAERTVLLARKAALEAALDALILGGTPVEVGTQGDTVKFSRGNEDSIRARIAEIDALLAGRPTAGALGFVW